MLIQFFFLLRKAGIRASITELLTLHETLAAGLADYSIDNFYLLARSTLVKDETQFDRFDQAYYLKPIGSGRGWLFRVYGEPWQLFRQTREDLELAETYEARPTPAECVERLKRP